MPDSKKQHRKPAIKQPQRAHHSATNDFGYVSPEDGIGDRIAAKRKELGLNVEEFARLTREYDYREGGNGIAPSTLRRYEYKEGGFNPGAREICLLCDALGVSADWLIRGIEVKSNDRDVLITQLGKVIVDAMDSRIVNDKDPIKQDQRKADWENTERI